MDDDLLRGQFQESRITARRRGQSDTHLIIKSVSGRESTTATNPLKTVLPVGRIDR